MIFEQIDQLKQQYTDKYVVVDAGRPELARFRDVVGQVKTVNMSGRALVEFGDYHINVGWYDIDLEFLKVVDKPAPKPKEAPAKKPAGEAASAAGKTAPKPTAARPAPAAKQAAAGKPSTADILAKLRGGGAVAPSTGAAAPTSEKAAAAKPAAPKSASPAGAAPTKVDRSKMSVADMLAAARASGAPKSGEPSSSGGQTAAPAEPIKTIPERDVEKMVEVDETPPTAQDLGDKAPSAKVDKKSMSVGQMIAWCREHDMR